MAAYPFRASADREPIPPMKVARRFSIQRFAALDAAIRAGRYPNARSLGSELEVHPRTIQRDIEFLRDRLGVPLAYDQVRYGYYYTDPTFRLPAVVLTEGELLAIFLAERVLQQFRGTPFAPQLARAFQTITALLDDRVTVDLGHLSGSISFRTSVSSEIDPELFTSLDSAIRGRRRLSLRYETASRGVESTREVDPYHLTSVDGRWYLVGYCHLRGAVRTFVPGRIRAIEVTQETFDSPKDFQIDDYLADSLSVLRGEDGELHQVRLRFTGSAATYVRERTWHHSQTIEEQPDGGLVLSLKVSHLREVERWALSWGGECEALNPPELRRMIADDLARALACYGRDQKGQGSPPTASKKTQCRRSRSAPE